MPRPQKTDAIVLSGSDLGESDRIITLYTLDFGKFRGVAKGAKRSRRRFLNALEPFTFLNVILVPSRTGGLGRIDQAAVRRSFPDIVHDWKRFSLASLCCELVSLWSREGDGDQRIFRLLYGLLSAISRCRDPYIPAITFKLQLLYLVGYGISLQRCLKCGSRLTAQGSFCSTEGFLCRSCGSQSHPPFSFQAIRLLQTAATTRIDRIGGLSASPEAVHEAWRLLKHLHVCRLQRTPASYNVLNERIGGRR